MKKLIVLSAFVATALVSCGEKKAETETTTTDSTVVETVEAPVADTTTVAADTTATAPAADTLTTNHAH
ncbi:hypothetical protein GR160_06635 [Flavobacterium sp. Sd200]|uniref:hypothetical protein n=1 Tax=Flavobacterium sp. Sd200 TaxID=2692211 RepID=UPI00136F64ED|nr:hypothetical protein [Flavobacterium sp. Sd200]MXN90900.1 hypothetical protein [Flavobacterium sp. Sd200]